jgi:hypothetical protein
VQDFLAEVLLATVSFINRSKINCLDKSKKNSFWQRLYRRLLDLIAMDLVSVTSTGEQYNSMKKGE